ncbi:MAG TPA: hypothetical protein VLA61_26495 [Ideonella sp.]|uniref:hypothetical protein n=1 Tax=Ideonella sp. TaxID=1929293 RepID=UPI002CE84779|nr:hypothetical protein [Ideonella sp.]HSI51834.1 hypothetical protein [Ideonella sp.]
MTDTGKAWLVRLGVLATATAGLLVYWQLRPLADGRKAEIASYAPGSARDRSLQYFKATEYRVVDAHWTSEQDFNVAVFNDKAPRDHYAQYVCEILTANGMQGQDVRVHVIDAAKLLQDGQSVTLAERRC